MNGETDEMATSQKESRCHDMMCRIRGTVILKIWPQIIFMTLYTVVICCLHNYVDELRMHFTLTLVPVIGVVTGLLLVFRTNTAYDRYWEGRKLWSTVNYQIRSLTLGIWLGVEDTHGQPKEKEPESENSAVAVDPETAGLVQKLSALNLLVAFVYALKNYLRSEYSYDEDEMKELISHLPKLQTPSSTKPLSSQGSYRRSISKNPAGATVAAETKPKKTGPQVQNQGSQEGLNSNSGSTTILFSKPEDGKKDEEQRKGMNKSSKRQSKKFQSLKAYDYITPSNIPLEIAYYLYSYIKTLGLKGPVETNCMRNMQASVLSLIDCLTGFERILRTPMPLAYRIHLICIVWIYLLALPFQLMMALNWWAVPLVTIASFALLGILAIGGEIENPFGYDENDLPLDDFCKVIQREIQVIVSRPMPDLDTWVMSKDNHPIAPLSWLTAHELMNKSGDEIREILAMGREPLGSFPASTHL